LHRPLPFLIKKVSVDEERSGAAQRQRRIKDGKESRMETLVQTESRRDKIRENRQRDAEQATMPNRRRRSRG
jgi:hypothetical protein